MATSSQLTLRVTAVNAASRVFRNIASSAADVTKTIAKWGAAAAGVAVGAFAMTANKLGKLSDVAQSAGTTTEELTKLSGALDMLGVKGSAPEELAAAFQRMTKATGEVGVEGFHRMIAEISKLPTITERSAAAMQVFGKSGLQFMPIIEGAAKNGVESLRDLEAAIPGISQAAADVGDHFSDAMGVMTKAAAKIWNQGLMKVASLITGNFTGDVRTAALICAAQMEYFAKASWEYVKYFAANWKDIFLRLAEGIAQWAANVGNIIKDTFFGVFEILQRAMEGWIASMLTRLLAVAEKVIHGETEKYRQLMNAANAELGDAGADIVSRFDRYVDKLKGYDWKIDLGFGNVDLAALQAQRDEAIKTAKKAGEAYGKAAVTITPEEQAKIDRANGGGIGGRRAANTNPEAILGGTYKAITYAMRQGYASGIEEVKSLIKKVVTGVKDVKDAVEANGLDAVPAVGG